MKHSFPQLSGLQERKLRSVGSKCLSGSWGPESRAVSYSASALQFEFSSSYKFRFVHLLLAVIDFCGYLFSHATITEYKLVICLFYRLSNR